MANRSLMQRETDMNRFTLFLPIALALAAGDALAQSHQPYAGFEARSIKALSDQQIADLRSGRGLSLALAAELNGYPGPMHTLELADSLGLSAEQRARVQSLFAAMKAEAIPLGEKLIAQEAELDRAFVHQTITAAQLQAATEAIGATQAGAAANASQVSPGHAHIPTPEQLHQYAALRGYCGTPARTTIKYGRQCGPGLRSAGRQR